MKNSLVVSLLLTPLIIFNTVYAAGIDLSITNGTVTLGYLPPTPMLYINLTSREDNEIKVNKVIVNRGSCSADTSRSYICSGSIKFGQTLKCPVFPNSCNIIEVVVKTEGGDYKFEPK